VKDRYLTAVVEHSLTLGRFVVYQRGEHSVMDTEAPGPRACTCKGFMA
jgi:hypothetical protein